MLSCDRNFTIRESTPELLCRLFIQNLRLSLEKSGGICYNIIDSTSCSFSLEKRRLSGRILDFSVGNCHRQFRYGGAVPCCTADFFVPCRRENDVRTGRDQEPLSAVPTAKKGCSVIKVCFREGALHRHGDPAVEPQKDCGQAARTDGLQPRAGQSFYRTQKRFCRTAETDTITIIKISK